MTKDSLRTLAEYGARHQVALIEKQLNDLQREFPNIFLTHERVLLLKAQERGNGNGAHRSAIAAKVSASWTPERKERAAKRMKAQQRKLQAAKREAEAARDAKPTKATRWKKKAKSKRHASNGHQKLKNRWYERLLTHGPESVGVSAKALDTTSASLLTSADKYFERGVIVKDKTTKGIYAVGSAAPEQQA